MSNGRWHGAIFVKHKSAVTVVHEAALFNDKAFFEVTEHVFDWIFFVPLAKFSRRDAVFFEHFFLREALLQKAKKFTTWLKFGVAQSIRNQFGVAKFALDGGVAKIDQKAFEVARIFDFTALGVRTHLSSWLGNVATKNVDVETQSIAF